MAAELVARAPFRVGQKELYLPNVTLTFLRTPFLPPTHASFTVPLWFNKLDMRDYLYHVYSVKTLSIRSYIKQQRLRQGVKDTRRPMYKNWYRPRSVKRMTVELERPFVWPAEPENYDAWGKKQTEANTKDNEAIQERMASTGDTIGQSDDARKAMREQAKALLEGRERWKPAGADEGAIGRRFGR